MTLMAHYFPKHGMMRYGINQLTVAKWKKRVSVDQGETFLDEWPGQGDLWSPEQVETNISKKNETPFIMAVTSVAESQHISLRFV